MSNSKTAVDSVFGQTFQPWCGAMPPEDLPRVRVSSQKQGELRQEQLERWAPLSLFPGIGWTRPDPSYWCSPLSMRTKDLSPSKSHLCRKQDRCPCSLRHVTKHRSSCTWKNRAASPSCYSTDLMPPGRSHLCVHGGNGVSTA